MRAVTDGTPPPRVPNRTWADLMQRSFGFDVLACPRCAGRLKLVALIQDGPVIQRILRHVGMPSVAPEMRLSRAPPEACRAMTRGDEKAGSALTERHRRARNTPRLVCLERRPDEGWV